MRVVRVYLECGRKRVFACALDWPGWARSGRTEELALSALDDYATRYAEVSDAAGLALPVDEDFVVVERLPGTTTTDFGAPDVVPVADGAPVRAGEAERLAALVRAAWVVFDRVAAAATR